MERKTRAWKAAAGLLDDTLWELGKMITLDVTPSQSIELLYAFVSLSKILIIMEAVS